MVYVDDRTEAETRTHTVGIVGTDRFLSGWGRSGRGTSFAVWATTPEHAHAVERWVRERSDMSRVRVVDLRTYRPRNASHVHVYVVDPTHPAHPEG